ncbi:hypothetical protein G6027_08555 [Dietzia sp. SLG310A2-38A2]|uniref:hypothetical protein n=1 Tax=Dietzia sp. SLG310A2-38A2 TaxID=1630643 RepID=UPI0015FD34D6|nr:hypothetical protein [Dietzia sp. SLG310A2-38A2]MBB1030937.1 hypothetical protein [Dietzia sp. SLG310A2-38A2]
MSERLRPDDVLLLYFAESYTTDRQDFPIYWSRSYGADDPQAALASLTKRGYLRIGDLPETLEAQPGSALKAVLKEQGQKTTGRKADLVARALDAIPSQVLKAAFPQSWYVLTAAGQKVLDDNPHIPYVHKTTHLDSVDIYSLDRMVHAESSTQWRNIVWRHLNEQVVLNARRSDWGLLRNTRHLMAEFLAEEGRWAEAIEILAEVIYYDLAVPGNGFDVDVIPILASRISPYDTTSLRVPPGLLSKLFAWRKKTGLDDDGLRELMLTKLQDTHSPLPVFTRAEVVQIVFWERDKATEALADLYEAADKRFRAAYEQSPNLESDRTARELR